MNLEVWINQVNIKTVAIFCDEIDSAHFCSLPVHLMYTYPFYTNWN